MVYQPPTGARDLLPLDVAQKYWIEDRLQQVFHQWGYHRIITSTLERLDTLMAGGAIDRATVLQLQAPDEEALGLRPELTASIARAVVSRMSPTAFPLRLYYTANVFRRATESSSTRQQEFYQAGIELLGAAGVAADAEVLLLLTDSLNHLELSDCHLILGEAGLTRSLLSGFPPHLQAQVRQAIAQLDRVALEQMAMTADLRERALLLMDLRGQPADVLQGLGRLGLTSAQQDAVNNLKSFVELFQNSYPPSLDNPPLRLTLDLSLLQTFDYYTGIVFEVASDSPAGLVVLGQGGRYDQLLGQFHPEGRAYPGIGFSLQIEALHQVLSLKGQLPHRLLASEWLVVPQDDLSYTIAFQQAHHLRGAGHSVTMALDLIDRSPDEIRHHARSRHVAQIAWVMSDGDVITESVTDKPG